MVTGMPDAAAEVNVRKDGGLSERSRERDGDPRTNRAATTRNPTSVVMKCTQLSPMTTHQHPCSLRSATLPSLKARSSGCLVIYLSNHCVACPQEGGGGSLGVMTTRADGVNPRGVGEMGVSAHRPTPHSASLTNPPRITSSLDSPLSPSV